MPPAKKPKTVADCLLIAQQQIGSIEKTGRNDFHGYDYVSAETMISDCRPVLHEAGIVMTAGDVELIPCSPDTMIVRVSYRLSTADDSTEISRDFPAVLSKGRPMDKAVAGALTSCLTYTLRDLLLIPRGDEEGVGMDDTKRSQREAATGPASAPRQPRTPQPSNGSSSRFAKGDTVQTSKGNVGKIFWIGGDKGDRVGVAWGEGDDEKEFTYMRFLQAVSEQPKPPANGAGSPDGAPEYDDEIPF